MLRMTGHIVIPFTSSWFSKINMVYPLFEYFQLCISLFSITHLESHIMDDKFYVGIFLLLPPNIYMVSFKLYLVYFYQYYTIIK